MTVSVEAEVRAVDLNDLQLWVTQAAIFRRLRQQGERHGFAYPHADADTLRNMEAGCLSIAREIKSSAMRALTEADPMEVPHA